MIRSFFLFFSLLCLFSCHREQPRLLTFSGEAMTMFYRVSVENLFSSEQETLVRMIIVNTFQEIDQIYNHWNYNSEISRVNRAKAGERILLSKELAEFLAFTEKWVVLTGGRFDPTIHPLQQLWKAKLSHGEIPEEQEIRAVLPSIGWNHVHLEGRSLWKDSGLLAFDLGGIAKGYAVDLLVERLADAGYRSVYVEWGGELRTSGRHPEGRPWRLSIAGRELVEEENIALASSGDEFQFWRVGETTYFHIFNPETRAPLVAKEGALCHATVAADKCCCADVIATTALLFETEADAKNWLESLRGRVPKFDYWIVSH